MTYYTIGIFETSEMVNNAISALHHAGATQNVLTLLTSAEASEISDIVDLDPETSALQGALAGTGIGGALGALGTVAALTIPGVGVVLASGLIATLSGGILGGYLGALYTMRAETNDVIDVKNAMTPDSMILIAQTESHDKAQSYSDILQTQGSQSTEIIEDEGNNT